MQSTTLALILARGGSKGLPRKNVLDLCGKPLIAWTIQAALESQQTSACVVSSDDQEIIDTAKAWGASVPFVRPPELATDTASSMDCVLHALDWFAAQGTHYDTIMLLQPTSPLRNAADIDAALGSFHASGANASLAVSACEHPPQWVYSLSPAGRLAPLFEGAHTKRRQDLPPCYSPNGAIYIAKVSWLRLSKSFVDTETLPYIMPRERSIDIDTLFDFKLAECVLRGITQTSV